MHQAFYSFAYSVDISTFKFQQPDTSIKPCKPRIKTSNQWQLSCQLSAFGTANKKTRKSLF